MLWADLWKDPSGKEQMGNFSREVKPIKRFNEVLEIKNIILFHGLPNSLSTYIKEMITEPESDSASCSVMSDFCDPIDYIPPGSSVPGILQARILWVVIPFSRRSSQPGIKHVSYSTGDSLPSNPCGSPLNLKTGQ